MANRAIAQVTESLEILGGIAKTHANFDRQINVFQPGQFGVIIRAALLDDPERAARRKAIGHRTRVCIAKRHAARQTQVVEREGKIRPSLERVRAEILRPRAQPGAQCKDQTGGRGRCRGRGHHLGFGQTHFRAARKSGGGQHHEACNGQQGFFHGKDT